MSKLIIVYDSKTGFTETMAKAIAEGTKSVEGVNVFLKNLNESPPPSVLEDIDTIALGSPSHNGNVTLETLVFLAGLKQVIDTQTLIVAGKLGFAFGSYNWDGGACIEKLHTEMENLGLKMEQKALAKLNPIPDYSSKEEFIKECEETGNMLAKRTLEGHTG